MTDVAPTELGKLLRNMFYKHSAPLALGDHRFCQQYPKLPHSKGSADLSCNFRACQTRLSFQSDTTSNASVRMCQRRIIESLLEITRGKLVINLRADFDRRQGRAGEFFLDYCG